MKSEFLKLKSNDFVKGLFVAILTAILTAVYQMIEAGGLSGLDYKEVLTIAFTAAISYLLKNLASNSDDKMLKKESK